MAYKLSDLKAMTDAELIERHDQEAKSTGTSLNYFLNELERRAAARRERIMIGLTVAIFALTIVNVVIVACTA